MTIEVGGNGLPLNMTATARSSVCPGGPMPLEINIGVASSSTDEDFLALDVLAPSTPVSKQLPVLVNIHGGGYSIGDASMAPGDAIMSHAKRNLVHVSIQYRLGPHGFLAGDAIQSDGVWNVGILAQRAALDWIQRNIAVFGGGPLKVTIVGGSAGGGSVSLQMMMYGGVPNPPFYAAIAGQSRSLH